MWGNAITLFFFSLFRNTLNQITMQQRWFFVTCTYCLLKQRQYILFFFCALFIFFGSDLRWDDSDFYLGFICDFSQPSLVMDIVRGIDPTCVFMVSGSLRHLKVLVFGSQSKSVLLTSWKRSWFGAKIRVNAWVLSIFFCLVSFVLDDKYRGIGFAWNTDKINKNGNEYNWWIDKYR